MTPGAQSLGSVGMGGDSVGGIGCSSATHSQGGATNNMSTSHLDDLLSSTKSANSSLINTNSNNQQQHEQQQQLLLQQNASSNVIYDSNRAQNQNLRQNPNQQQQRDQQVQQAASDLLGQDPLDSLEPDADMLPFYLDDKSDILMNKLMMEEEHQRNTSSSGSRSAGHSLLARTHQELPDVALALEEAKWKQREQQLEARGKSEHLANFLNEPMKSKASANQHSIRHAQAQQMLSGGLNPSDDESDLPLAGEQNLPPNLASLSSDLNEPSQKHHLEVNIVNNQNSANVESFSEFASYLDTVDSGAGLPPDDSILDLFER